MCETTLETQESNVYDRIFSISTLTKKRKSSKRQL